MPGNKKADVDEHSKAFVRVGLLDNEPSSDAGMLFASSSNKSLPIRATEATLKSAIRRLNHIMAQDRRSKGRSAVSFRAGAGAVALTSLSVVAFAQAPTEQPSPGGPRADST